MVFRLILTKGSPHNVYSFLHTTLDTSEYAEEYELFVKRYGLELRSEKNH